MDYGLKAQQQKSRTWGKDGVTGGGTKFHQGKVNDKFVIIPSVLNKKNIITDKPYDAHINQKGQ